MVLEPFEAATRKLSSDSSPTVSIVLPIITALITSLENRVTDPPFLKMIKDTLRTSLEKRFKDIYEDKLVRRKINKYLLSVIFLLAFAKYSIRSTVERFFMSSTFILSES